MYNARLVFSHLCVVDASANCEKPDKKMFSLPLAVNVEERMTLRTDQLARIPTEMYPHTFVHNIETGG